METEGVRQRGTKDNYREKRVGRVPSRPIAERILFEHVGDATSDKNIAMKCFQIITTMKMEV